MRSSRGGRPERTLGEHPHVLGGRVVAWLAVVYTPFKKGGVQEFRNYRWFEFSLHMSIFSHRELF